MHIIFYNTSSDHNTINKSLSVVAEVDANPVDPVDIISPNFKLGSISLESMKNANYAYIAEYHRYYYVSAPVTTNNKMFFVNMTVDPLMSFKNAIKNLKCIVDKIQAEGSYNLDYDDGSYINEAGRFLEIKVLPEGFNDTPTNILIVAGG